MLVTAEGEEVKADGSKEDVLVVGMVDGLAKDDATDGNSVTGTAVGLILEGALVGTGFQFVGMH